MKRSRYTEKQMIGSCRSRTPEHQLRSCAAYRARVQRVIQLALHETFRGLEPRFAGKRGRQTATVTVCWRSARQMTGSIRTRHLESRLIDTRSAGRGRVPPPSRRLGPSAAVTGGPIVAMKNYFAVVAM